MKIGVSDWISGREDSTESCERTECHKVRRAIPRDLVEAVKLICNFGNGRSQDCLDDM